VFVDVDNVALDVLEFAIVLPVGDSRSEPGKKVCDCGCVIGFGFGKSLLGDLDVEVLGTGETESGGEVDGPDVIRRLSRTSQWVCEQQSQESIAYCVLRVPC
jgi:hypothetical protein